MLEPEIVALAVPRIGCAGRIELHQFEHLPATTHHQPGDGCGAEQGREGRIGRGRRREAGEVQGIRIKRLGGREVGHGQVS